MKVNAIVFCCSAALAAWSAPFLRIGSGPLNASVENERDAAIDRAVAWLVASQSPEGHWGGSNVVATAAAALAIRGDREEMPQADAAAVDKAVKWLKSPACTNALYTIPPQKSYLRINGVIPNTPRQRAIAWRRLALSVLAPTETSVSTNHLGFHGVISFVFERQTIFDEQLSSTLAFALLIRLGGRSELEVGGAPDDPALAFIAATFVKTPPPAELKPLVEKLARTWNEGSPAVWLSNPEAGWWLARAINGATGGDLSLPADADGRVRNVNWRGIMAGKWINSQRIDSFGNGHWDGDAEKTAFAVLLLNEM